MRRNTTYTVYVWPRVLHPLWAFAFLSISPPTIVFLLAYISLHIPVLPFPPALPSVPRTSCFVPNFSSQNPLEHARARTLLQRTSPHPSTLFSCISLFRTSLRSRTSHVCLTLILKRQKSSWACPLEVFSPVYFLPFPPALPCTVDLTLIFFCNAGFSPFIFLKFFWRICLQLTTFLFVS